MFLFSWLFADLWILPKGVEKYPWAWSEKAKWVVNRQKTSTNLSCWRCPSAADPTHSTGCGAAVCDYGAKSPSHGDTNFRSSTALKNCAAVNLNDRKVWRRKRLRFFKLLPIERILRWLYGRTTHDQLSLLCVFVVGPTRLIRRTINLKINVDLVMQACKCNLHVQLIQPSSSDWLSIWLM